MIQSIIDIQIYIHEHNYKDKLGPNILIREKTNTWAQITTYLTVICFRMLDI